ncbi:MAG: tRNA ((7)-)-methyltransferase [Gammaproteobacteria bacterium]|jgi:tRNA (guanine-N7-)-methyltransferase|nr:tRNA ((7)-)-methyltransferase [Gammaproteobacteria bacterium]
MSESIYPPRRIKSFARCAGRMTPAQKLAVDTVLPGYGWIKNTVMDKPLILDIGFGMGHSLAWQAEQYSQFHFLGAEVFLPGAARLATLLQEKKLSNVHIAYGDVVLLLKEQLALQSLSGVQIFFPDPWPKKRHHKRRLLQTDFLNLLLTHMEPGAFLHFASDWADYCVGVKALLASHSKLSFEKPFGGIEVLERPQTRYENRGVVQGHEIEDIVVWVTS